MAAGVAVVSTDVSGIPELITDGVDGMLVPPEDPGALAEVLARLATDEALRRRLAGAGRATVGSRFDGDALARELAALHGGDAVIPVDVGRDVICVVDEQRRDLAVAVAARRRTVHPQRRHARARPRARLARGPDCRATSSGATEWAKQNEGLDLAHAFAETGDERFLAGLAAAGHVVRSPGPGRPRPRRGVGPADAELGVRLAALPPRRRRPRPRPRRRPRRPSPGRRRAPRRPPHARAQPPDARAVRAARRRPGPRRSAPVGHRPRPDWPRTPPPTYSRTASIASDRATTT